MLTWRLTIIHMCLLTNYMSTCLPQNVWNHKMSVKADQYPSICINQNDDVFSINCFFAPVHRSEKHGKQIKK
jgi:hypothetical protein